jgi:hypothetical protein
MRQVVRIVTKRPLLTGLWASAWVSCLVAGFAVAQGGGAEPPPAAEPREVNGTEQLSQAERVLGDSRAAAKRIQGLVDEARRERDLIRLTCLSDKLAQYNAGLTNLEQRVENLRAAVRAGDTGRANHEYTVTGVIRQKQEVLSREVNQCIGQDLYETGDTSIEFVFVGDFPGGDALQLSGAGPYEVPLVPPPASPLR